MIDRDVFVEWAKNHFENVIVKDDEVKVNDIWHSEPDHKNHCWINTKKACFRAFKSGKTGHLLELVMDIEKCSWGEAVQIMGGDNALSLLEARMERMLADNSPVHVKMAKSNPVNLPPGTYHLIALSSQNPIRMAAENYLKSRKLDISNLLVCIQGKYRNRIIIPYYGREGELIYFNSRDIGKSTKLRYMGPLKEEFGVGKSDVLWLHHWPASGAKLYLTEGEFDAMSLCQCKLHGAACGGKSLDEKQIEMLRPYRVTLAFDNDKAGEDGFRVCEQLHKIGFPHVGYVRPPSGFKDWNQFLVEHSPNLVAAYIQQEERPFGQDTISRLGFERVRAKTNEFSIPHST